MKLPLSSDIETKEDDISIEGLCVLAAEDNELNREIIAQVLSLLKITVITASDGNECLNRLVESEINTFDIVLMDMQMPNLDGKETAALIRKNSREDIRSIPIIAITADDFSDKLIACKECGTDGYVSKPIDSDNLKAEIRRVILKKKKRTHDRQADTLQTDEITAACDTYESDNEVFSYKELYAIFENDETVLNILQAFLSSHANDINLLKKQFADGDYRNARPILHGIIGISGNLRMHRLFNITKELQAQVHSGKSDCFDIFAQVWEQTICEITAVCKKLNYKITDFDSGE